MSQILRFFLITEGKDGKNPSYEDASIHFSIEDPCHLDIKNLFASSPLFSVIQQGVNKLPSLEDGTQITFIMMPSIYPFVDELVSSLQIKSEIWFTLGLANIVVIENKESAGITKNVIEYLKAKENIIASETWVVDKGKVKKYSFPFSLTDHHDIETEKIDLKVSEKLPLHLKFAVSEYILTTTKFLTACKKFTPAYYDKHISLFNTSTFLINDLSFLSGDFSFNPSGPLVSALGATSKDEAQKLLANPDLSKRKEELINDRNGRLIQFNSSMSYVYSQTFAGTFPLFDHIGLIQRHSLLGIGTAISSLTELLNQIEGALYFLPFEQINNSSYATVPVSNLSFYDCFQEASLHSLEIWKNDTFKIETLKAANPTKNSKQLPNGFFTRLAFYSGRLGFREYDFSATAAVQVLVEGNSLQWNVINYTHEIIHNHVRLILDKLILPATSIRQEGYEEWLQKLLDKLKSIFLSISRRSLPEGVTYVEYFILILIKYCINSKYYGSLSLPSDQEAINRIKADTNSTHKYFLPKTYELKEVILAQYKDISEIFVHVLDFSYIYTRKIDTYLQSIWASWSTVSTVSMDLNQYILRTLIISALNEPGTMSNRYERSKTIFLGNLQKIAGQNGNAYLFSRIEKILSEEEDDIKARFYNCIIIGDLCYTFFVGELESYLDNDDSNRLPKVSTEPFFYSIEKNSFSGQEIKSKVRFLLDQLIREIHDNSYNQEDAVKERTTSWLLLSLSSLH